MKDDRFKEIVNKNVGNLFRICYIYYREVGQEKGYNLINEQDFDSLFNMFCMGDLSGVVSRLKQKHNYK